MGLGYPAIPYVLAAYRASTHESTGMTPNFVATGREVHAPVDLVYTPPDELIDQMRRAHTLVREQLGLLQYGINGIMTCE